VLRGRVVDLNDFILYANTLAAFTKSAVPNTFTGAIFSCSAQVMAPDSAERRDQGAQSALLLPMPGEGGLVEGYTYTSASGCSMMTN
jgi:hypothetical protein